MKIEKGFYTFIFEFLCLGKLIMVSFKKTNRFTVYYLFITITDLFISFQFLLYILVTKIKGYKKIYSINIIMLDLLMLELDYD